MPRLPIIAAACTALALALAIGACGADKESQQGRDPGDDGATVTTNPTPAVQTSTQSEEQERNDFVSVGMRDIKFIPHDVTAKVGQKIVWENSDDAPHNVTATGGADFASDTINKGQTYEYTPTKPGTITYVCTIHSGQDGQITVTK